MKKYKLNKGDVLVLRTCNSDMSSQHDPEFFWPKKGPVSAPDFKPTVECGHGLHGFLWGEGDGSLASWDVDAKWLVVSVKADEIIQLDGKVKFPKGEVVLAGDRLTATQFIASFLPRSASSIGCTVTGGDSATVTGGDRATVTGGHRATVTGGDSATVTGGDSATVTGGDSAIISIKYWDDKANRYRLAVGYPGEDGIEAGKQYHVVNGQLAAVSI